MPRIDGRADAELRPVRITPGFLDFAEGSALIEMGLTRVLCAATVEDRVPPFLKGSGAGWVTAEYSMLPRSTHTRTQRETGTRISGRTQEIQRLIGRALRAVTDLSVIGERSITIDCDVIQADGGTRTASITGGYIALLQALQGLAAQRAIPRLPLTAAVAAVSVGIINGRALLDLCYDEDSRADVDFNVIMTSRGEFVEVQGTAEGRPFSEQQMLAILETAKKGLADLFQIQKQVSETITGR